MPKTDGIKGHLSRNDVFKKKYLLSKVANVSNRSIDLMHGLVSTDDSISSIFSNILRPQQNPVGPKDIFNCLFPGGFAKCDAVSDDLGLGPPLDKNK